MRGHCVLDLFGSRDGEGLAWLRSPFAKDKKCLILHGENVTIESPFESKQAGALVLEDFMKYDIIVSASPCYTNPDDEFMNAARITDKIYRRLHWTRLIYALAREASNFYYSRLKVSDNQLAAKAGMIYLIREARHMGLALGLDSLRTYSLDIDVRSLADFTILKSQGMAGLSNEMHWLYSLVEPMVLQNMPKRNFVILSKLGAVGLGEFEAVPWHKQEREHILQELGIRITYGEEIDEGKNFGTFKTVGDPEHAEMVRLYLEDGLSFGKIAERLSRSSATIKAHADEHNLSIRRSGYCYMCRRMKSPRESVLFQKVKEGAGGAKPTPAAEAANG